MKVLELTNRPQLDTHELKACIENDPALTTRILRVVNSSLFGLSREVSDLNQALTLLGTKPLKLLVLGFSLPDGMFSDVSGDVLGPYWRHTLTKAVAAREVSESLWRVPGDDAFIAGLLQDLGVLLMIQVVGEPYTRFLRRAAAASRDVVALESETMGFDHTALTARLLTEWHLPDSITRNVSWRDLHQAIAAPTRDASPLPQILHLAELIARLLADGHADVLGELLQVGKQYRDLSQPKLEALVADLEDKVQQLADVLRLDLPHGMDYREVLVQAHLQLAETAAEAAGELLKRSRPARDESAEASPLAEEMAGLSEAVSNFSRGAPPPPAALPPKQPPADAASLAPKVPAAQSALAAPVPHARGARSTALANGCVEPDPGLLGRLGAAVAACRQARRSLSLLLVEPDNLDELLLTRGVEGTEIVPQVLQKACGQLDHTCPICLPYGELGFAVILPDCDRQKAARLAHQLLDHVRRVPLGPGAIGEQRLQVSLGAASVVLPPRNFPAQDLLDAASRCLYGSHVSGGGVVKSIEIY